jgi:hypothetical protein
MNDSMVEPKDDAIVELKNKIMSPDGSPLAPAGQV